MAENLKKVACLGAGYVGGPSMAVLAQHCPNYEIYLVDNDPKKVEAWNSPNLPIHEPGLDAIIESVLNKNLHITTDIENAVVDADIIFIAVNTPTKSLGEGAGKSLLVNHVEHVAREIGKYSKKEGTIVVEKSTVPVGVSRSIKAVLNSNSPIGNKFRILSNPEFLSEGSAIQNLLNPERILIGNEPTSECQEAALILKSIYQRWIPEEKILLMDCWSAELAKLASSAFLAQRISSINAISAICEKTGANVTEVARACGADPRIGPKFLQASFGFGGSNLTRDIRQLSYIAESLKLPEVARYWEKVVQLNDYQIERFSRDIVHTLFDTLMNKNIAIFGFAYKANTNDSRDSPSTKVCAMLLEEGAYLNIVDSTIPKEQIYNELESFNPKLTQQLLNQKVRVFNTDLYEAANEVHAIVILNDSAIFCNADYQRIYLSMSKPAFIFDGRNLLDRKKLREIGFCTHSVGVPPDLLES